MSALQVRLFYQLTRRRRRRGQGTSGTAVDNQDAEPRERSQSPVEGPFQGLSLNALLARWSCSTLGALHLLVDLVGV